MTERCQKKKPEYVLRTRYPCLHPVGAYANAQLLRSRHRIQESECILREGLNPQIIRHSKEFLRINFSAPCHLA